MELVVEPWLEGVYKAISNKVSEIKKLPKENIDELLKTIEIVKKDIEHKLEDNIIED